MLVDRAQVLDLGAVAREGWGTPSEADIEAQKPRDETPPVIDPGALGTLIIGTQANLHDDERAALQLAHERKSIHRPGSARTRLAATLRSIAARLEPLPAA
jgi:hypothetical protein